MTRIWHRGEDLLIRVVEGLVRGLPERWALAIGAGLGWMAGRVFRIRASVVAANLRRAFPERDERWIQQTAADFYRHLGREAVVLLRMGGMAPDEILARTDVEGLEHLTRPLAEGRGVILLAGHLGNWEFGGAALGVRGIPMDGVAKRQNNPAFNDRINAMRERNGMRVIERHQANTRMLLRSLRAGRVVVLVADQNVLQGGAFVEFFGTPAATARGPELLAQHTGAAVVFSSAIRLPGLPSRYRIRLRPIAAEAPAADPGVLRAYLACLEDDIRSAPSQYLWAHKRWKTRPPAEPDPAAPERDASATVPIQ
jgi:Kdo2-lipid IVA lauroyltransferase/acyltransferase